MKKTASSYIFFCGRATHFCKSKQRHKNTQALVASAAGDWQHERAVAAKAATITQRPLLGTLLLWLISKADSQWMVRLLVFLNALQS